MSAPDQRDDCLRCGRVDLLDGGLCPDCVDEVDAENADDVSTYSSGSYRQCTLCGTEYVGTCELCTRCNNWTITGKDTPT